MKIKKKQRKTKAADIYVKENVSTGKEKATYLYMEQNSKDTNKIFLGENMKNCNIFFFYRKKISPMTWFYSNNSIYTRVGETIN